MFGPYLWGIARWCSSSKGFYHSAFERNGPYRLTRERAATLRFNWPKILQRGEFPKFLPVRLPLSWSRISGIITVYSDGTVHGPAVPAPQIPISRFPVLYCAPQTSARKLILVYAMVKFKLEIIQTSPVLCSVLHSCCSDTRPGVGGWPGVLITFVYSCIPLVAIVLIFVTGNWPGLRTWYTR